MNVILRQTPSARRRPADSRGAYCEHRAQSRCSVGCRHLDFHSCINSA